MHPKRDHAPAASLQPPFFSKPVDGPKAIRKKDMKKQLPTGWGKSASQEGTCTSSFLAATFFSKPVVGPKAIRQKDVKKQLPTGWGKSASQEGSCTSSFLAATVFFKTGCRPKGDQTRSHEKTTSDWMGQKCIPRRIMNQQLLGSHHFFQNRSSAQRRSDKKP